MTVEAAIEGGEAGEKRFERIRAELFHVVLPAETAIDAIGAALAVFNLDVADRLAEKLLTGLEARKAFHTLLDIYRGYDREEHFRQLQRTIALRRLKGS